MREQERIAEFRKRGHTNPPTYKPNTPGWQRLGRRREKQLYEVKDTQQRWDGFTSLMCMGVLVNNFTRLGFQVADVPGEWHAKLRAELNVGLSKKLPTESSIPHMVSGVSPSMKLAVNAPPQLNCEPSSLPVAHVATVASICW